MTHDEIYMCQVVDNQTNLSDIVYHQQQIKLHIEYKIHLYLISTAEKESSRDPY